MHILWFPLQNQTQFQFQIEKFGPLFFVKTKPTTTTLFRGCVPDFFSFRYHTVFVLWRRGRVSIVKTHTHSHSRRERRAASDEFSFLDFPSGFGVGLSVEVTARARDREKAVGPIPPYTLLFYSLFRWSILKSCRRHRHRLPSSIRWTKRKKRGRSCCVKSLVFR